MNIAQEATNVIEPHESHWVGRAAFPVISAALILAELGLAVALQRGWFWVSVPLVLVISHLMHGQIIGLHEASHGLLRKSRRLNELDGILIGTFSFMSFTLYRVTHQTHHAHLSTERDEELWPFVFPGSPRWARMLAAFLELTVGLLFTPFLFLRSFLRSGSPIRSPKVRKRIWLELALIVVVWTGILSAVAWGHAWKYFLGMYLAPAVIAADLQSWRKYIEHVGLTGRTVNGSTRNIVADGWLGRLVAFTPLHQPFHGGHHPPPGLTHAELPQFATELQPANPGERPPFPSYRHALADLHRHFPDPRVGAQWKAAAPA